MLSDLKSKMWKEEFHFKNTEETMLRLKYSNKWYFPAMLIMMLILLVGFVLFIIGFFLLGENNIRVHTIYCLSVIVLIGFWSIIYHIIQKKAISPYSPTSNGYLVFYNNKVIIKRIDTRQTSEYFYSEIKNVHFNRRTAALALLTDEQTIIFNEILNAEDVPRILNLLFRMTKIKPKIDK